MQAANLLQYNSLLAETLPPEIAAVPSMMSIRERQFIYGLAKDEYQGQGLIVDAGVFLGASTRCFGEGFRRNKRFADLVAKLGKPIRTFEFGLVNPGMTAFFERHGIEKIPVGESFVPILKANIAPVADYVDINIGDICNAEWCAGKIEILFLDVLKSEQIQDHVVRTFFPSLYPGSIVLQQDYFIDGVPFVKILQESMAESFDYLGEIQSMAIFRVKREIDVEAVLGREYLKGEKVRLLEKASERSIDADRKFMVHASIIRHLFESGEELEAMVRLQKLEREFPAQTSEKALPRLRSIYRTLKNLFKAEVNPS